MRDVAYERLKRLTGADLPRDADVWRNWIDEHGR
jgi:hypothetical protein